MYTAQLCHRSNERNGLMVLKLYLYLDSIGSNILLITWNLFIFTLMFILYCVFAYLTLSNLIKIQNICKSL